RHADAVAQTRRVEAAILALRREGNHKGTALIRLPGGIYLPLAGIAARTYRNEHPRPILGEDDIPRRMPAARHIADNRLCWPAWVKIASAIRKTDYAIGVRHLGVTGTWSRPPAR